ncbi:hypothetical protein M8J77_021076 [Diaphorina citri]|nr:hypothetical protein M8J77_021076 [Diaphorina citri]
MPPMNEESAEEWTKWIQRFKIYEMAGGMINFPDERRRAILLHSIGTRGVEIFNSLKVAQDATYDQVVSSLEGYFKPKLNVTYERHIFFTCCQNELTIDEYVTSLKLKAKTCEFGTLEDGLIRDRIICGIKNTKMKQRLLQEKDLSLEKTVEMLRIQEVTQKQVDVITDQTEDMKLEACAVKHKNVSNRQSFKKSYEFNCNRCGKVHGPRQCPAFGARCHICGHVGHFSKKCRKRRKSSGRSINQVDVDSPSNQSVEVEEFYVGSIDSVDYGGNSDTWSTMVTINDQIIPMMLDTGAQCNLMSMSQFKELKLPRSCIKPAKVKLTSYCGSNIDVVVLDASTAFWSVKLDKESSKLCTFNTPFARYRFLRLPYGISCAPEKFHQKLYDFFSDIPGVLTYIDDILVFGSTKAEHDLRLKLVFDKTVQKMLWELQYYKMVELLLMLQRH